MDAPRSRRLLSPSGGHRTDNLLPQCLSENTLLQLPDSMIYEKKPKVQVTWVLFFAIAGTFLFTTLMSVKTHFEQSLVASFDHTLTVKNPADERLPPRAFKFVSDGVHDSASRKGKVDHADRSLKGLLADSREFQPDKCASRGHQLLGTTEYKPSAYLIERLREYESLHRKCAGRARDFVQNDDELLDTQSKESFKSENHGDQCRFVVWIAYSGLGNRLLSLASAFLYALLTNRVLLVDKTTDMDELFCEPFPGTSWLVPPEFPHIWLEGLNESSQQRFGKLLNGSVTPPPRFSYVHLTHTYDLDDRMFFCDQGQDYLHPIPWLFMRSNNYIVPGLYFLSSFRPQLERLFSEKEAIFHLLGRYLFHPSNAVWSWITRFRRSYLANHEEQVGIQIRTFKDEPQAYFEEQLFRCALENRLLPNITTVEENKNSSKLVGSSNKLTSVLVTSLQPEYYEKLRDFYMSAPTEDGQLVAVHQPSHEGWQKTDSFGHDLKAWADIYLLSFSDVLITSGWSTFGYSAQALAGLRPWIIFRSMDGTVPNPPCVYAKSMEPCFHTPPLMDCHNTGVPRDPSSLLPFVQTCEDIPWGIKLVDAVTALYPRVQIS